MDRMTHRMRTIVVFGMLLWILVFSGCATLGTQDDQLTQVSVLNALLLGEYDGFVAVDTLKSFGDIGIGTFDTLDGEMIFLDGVVYQAKANGTVLIVDDDMQIPFAMVTHSSTDVATQSLDSVKGIEILKSTLDQVIAQTTKDFNRFYVVKLPGSFNHIRVRSVPAQQKPYVRLSEIAATQKEYVYEDIEGTIVAFRCPDYVNGINMPGWHFHFLSSDTSKGGHLLEVDIEKALLEMGDMKEYRLLLPSSESFAAMDIAHDLTQETHQIEGAVTLEKSAH